RSAPLELKRNNGCCRDSKGATSPLRWGGTGRYSGNGRPELPDSFIERAPLGVEAAIDMRASTTELEKRLGPSALYSSKIIKAGVCIADTKTLLSKRDVGASVAENISWVQRDNIFGKASRSRVEAILAIFRQRYLTEESVTKGLVTLVREKFSTVA